MPKSTAVSAAQKHADEEELYFNVSSGLKRIIGRELITDDEVAVFELVKNSFDANAKSVSILFQPDCIVILDNGDGMTQEDVKDKWLFVEYSSKKDYEQGGEATDFREQVQDRKHYAGSKGIGRFSCDRLGRRLTMQTRPRKSKSSVVHKLDVNLDRFEADETQQFGVIPVEYTELQSFSLDKYLTAPKAGTALEIRGLRTEWSRSRVLHLKASLAKLINPFGATTDGFAIQIIAPDEISGDEASIAKFLKKGQDVIPSAIVNGEVGNFVFGALREKTTYIEVEFENNGTHILTTSEPWRSSDLNIYCFRPTSLTSTSLVAKRGDFLKNLTFRCQTRNCSHTATGKD